MKQVFGIVFSNMHDHMVRELTVNRCMGSLPVGGRYRLVDFVLSGLSNAGIYNVSVVAKSNYKSLLDHIGNGREWDMARKRGGLTIMPPAALSDSGDLYRGRVEALAGILGIVQDSSAEYVLCADCDLMANIDYSALCRSHEESGADMTVVYKKQYFDGAPTRDLSTFILNEKNDVTEMRINPEVKGEQNEYLNIMIISRDLLDWIIKDCISRNMMQFDRDAIQANIGKFKIRAYEFTDYAYRFDSLRAFYESNMALLDPKVRASIFNKERPIYTHVWDEPPVRYGLDAKVENSLLADGCVVEGEVENSILFRGVTVDKGAKVRNSIVMTGSYVGDYVKLENAILDKRVILKSHRTMVGHETYPFYIPKGTIV